jgi:signal transduction histidine kinase
LREDDAAPAPIYAGDVSSVYLWLSRHPRLVDAVPALLLAVLGLASAGPGGLPSLLPIVLAMAVALVFRRRYPVEAFAAAIAAGAVQVVTITRPIATDLAIPVLLYTLAAYRPRRLSLPGLAVCLIGSVVAVAAWVSNPLGTVQKIGLALVIFSSTALLAWVLGDSMAYRRAYLTSLEDRAARLERERDAQAQVAAAAERARIARELHDVIAHNVSVMVVQADGASYALRSDTERAATALAAISRTGRQALAEMRRLLGVLRSGDEEVGLAPVPGLDQLRELLGQARDAGMSVSLTVDGTPRSLPEGAELAAYRVVQESLTNTRKHGGPAAAAAVTMQFQPDGLLLRVTDDGLGAAAAADGTGHGLTGMRERVEMYGGKVEAGPLPGGGYQVTARLPDAGIDVGAGTAAAGVRAIPAGPGPR